MRVFLTCMIILENGRSLEVWSHADKYAEIEWIDPEITVKSSLIWKYSLGMLGCIKNNQIMNMLFSCFIVFGNVDLGQPIGMKFKPFLKRILLEPRAEKQPAGRFSYSGRFHHYSQGRLKGLVLQFFAIPLMIWQVPSPLGLAQHCFLTRCMINVDVHKNPKMSECASTFGSKQFERVLACT